MDEHTIEELEFHTRTVQSDDHTPLHLIREKEIEISGRVLAAKRQADEIVADARRQAGELMAAAHEEASQEAGQRDEAVKDEMRRQMAEVRQTAGRDAEALGETVKSRIPDAVARVVDAVISV